MRALQVLHGPAKAHLHEPEKLNWVCQVLEDEAIKAYAAAINTNIDVKPLKVGYTGEPDEIACQWEFRTR